jgi:hypothetical protein
MFRGKWNKMLLVNAADGESAAGDSVDFGQFFGGGGATKNESETETETETDDQETEDYEDEADEQTDDEDGSDGDDADAEGGDDDETSDEDSTAVSLAAIKQHQEIIADLLKKSKETETPVEEPPVEVDPFESEEFSSMVEVMNWDEDEAAAAKTFFQKFMDFGNKKAFDRFNQETPQMIETTIQRNERIKAARRDFYENNPMLGEVKPFVGQIAQGVAQEMGESATMEAVLEESAKRAYKALGVDPEKVKELATQQRKKGKTKPAFPVKKGVRKQTTKPPKIQQEIDAVIGI